MYLNIKTNTTLFNMNIEKKQVTIVIFTLV